MGEKVVERATQLLNLLSGGDVEAGEALMPLIYDEMSNLARAHMAREQQSHTLQPTDLIHETYIRLFRADGASWPSRKHFYAMASKVMRNILVDHARRKKLKNAVGQELRYSLDQQALPSVDVVDLHETLEALTELDPQLGQLVELRYFGGLSMTEIAEILNVSTRTLERRWPIASAWLRERLHG